MNLEFVGSREICPTLRLPDFQIMAKFGNLESFSRDNSDANLQQVAAV